MPITMPIMQEQWVRGHADLSAFLALNTMPIMQVQWVRGHADLIAYLALNTMPTPHNANCAYNAIWFLRQCQICVQCHLCNQYNAKCANNAISATYTMPIVHTISFMQHTQCQLCIQCHLSNPAYAI